MNPRAEAKSAASSISFDLCVIGGGATGAGCALDAQLRGIATVLLEAEDFASGASSASTKLVHGGVRYLEQSFKSFNLDEYRLVKDALTERAYMLANAGHLARLTNFLIPVYSWAKAAYYFAGIKIYDAIAGKRNLHPSRFLHRAEAVRRVPDLRSEGLRGAIQYSDGQFDDSRFNLALVDSFIQAGGTALNHARVEQFAKHNSGQIVSANVYDQISRENFVVSAKIFINATGAGADRLRLLANPSLATRMRPSRGVHLLFPRGGFDGNSALLVPHTDDGRVIFALPWQDRLLVGTTDDQASPETPTMVERREGEYLLRQLNRYLQTPLELKQAVSGMAGLRPLVSAGDHAKTKELLRDHKVEVDDTSGLISILGGKWTTYRLMAQDTIDAVQSQLGISVSPSRTKAFPLAGAIEQPKNFSNDLEKEYALPRDVAVHLTCKFGANARRVLNFLQENPAWVARIAPGLPAIQAEVIYCVRYEMAETMEDLLARRTGIQLFGWREALDAAPVVAALLAREKGWDAERTEQVLTEYQKKIGSFLVQLGLCEG